jgi:hypothetical protein
MPKVWADDEEVQFNEGIPSDTHKIYELLMGALAEQRKAVVEFIVDGNDALSANSFPDGFEEIRAKSMTHDEITLRLIVATISQTQNLEAEIDAYSKNILSTPWTAVVKQMDQFIAKIQPFADLIDNVSPYASAYSPPWSERINEIAKVQATCLSQLLKAFEANNPASLSDEINSSFLPLIKNLKQIFSKEVIPHLRQISTPDSNNH